MVRCGVAWFSVVWRGLVWCVVIWCGVVWCGGAVDATNSATAAATVHGVGASHAHA